MTKLQIRAFLYQLFSFAIFFFGFRFIIASYTSLTSIWIPMTAFVFATILAPKFYASKINGTEKIYLSWLFIKGIKEIG